GVIAEIDPRVIQKRYSQGWVNEVYSDLEQLLARVRQAQSKKEAVSLAYEGNIVDLWERLAKDRVKVDIGSDQTSLHHPFSGGYYPAGLSLEESRRMMVDHPEEFKKRVHESLVRQVNAIHRLAEQGMYFFDYGNAFL